MRALWGVPARADRGRAARARPGAVAAAPGRERPSHFLYVGDDEPRKNLGTLLAAYARYRASRRRPARRWCWPARRRARRPGVARRARPRRRAARRAVRRRRRARAPVAVRGLRADAARGDGARDPGDRRARAPGSAEVCGDAARYADPADAGGVRRGDGRVAGATGAARASSPSAAAARRRFSWAASARAHVDGYSLAVCSAMKIAILGTRGIPASYSGFETAVEQLASRLTERGHEVVVYCRPHVVDRRLAPLQGRASSSTCARSRTSTSTRSCTRSLSAIHAARVTKPDVALFFIAGNSPLCLITRAGVDPGGDQRRRARLRPRASGRRSPRPTCASPSATAPRWADRAITDSHAVADIFERRYGQRIGVVPYGVEDPGPRRHRDARAAGARAAQVHPVRRPARAGEQPAPARRGVRADRPPRGRAG